MNIDKVSAVLTDTSAPRALATIAREIRGNWTKVYFGAVPYLDAMSTLGSVHSDYAVSYTHLPRRQVGGSQGGTSPSASPHAIPRSG